MRVEGRESRVEGSGFRVQGSGFRVQGPGCRGKSTEDVSIAPKAADADTTRRPDLVSGFRFTMMDSNLVPMNNRNYYDEYGTSLHPHVGLRGFCFHQMLRAT